MRSLIQVAVNILVIALVAAGGYVILQLFEPNENRRPSFPRSEKTWTVDGARAEPGDYRAVLSAYGRLQSGQSLAVRAPLAGTAVRLGDAMANGGQVAQGDLLLEIDPISLNRQVEQIKTQLAELEAQESEAALNLRLLKGQLERDRAQLALTKKEEQRLRGLVEQGFATTTQLDQASRSTLSAEQAQFQREQAIEQSQSRIVQLEQSKLRLISQRDEALDRAQDTRILAPFAGVLSEVVVAQGEEINANAVLARLQNVRALEVEFELSERDFARFIDPDSGQNLLKGSQVEVIWSPGQTPLVYQARVERFAPMLNQQTAGVLVYARLALANNQASPPLAAFVEVRLMDRPYENVLRLPQAALHAGSRIFAIGNNRRLAGYEAVRLRDEGNTVVLRVEDLPDGACIMTTNLPVAGDGVKVAMVGDPTPARRPGTRLGNGARRGGVDSGAAGEAANGGQAARAEAPAVQDQAPKAVQGKQPANQQPANQQPASQQPASQQPASQQPSSQQPASEVQSGKPGRQMGGQAGGKPGGERAGDADLGDPCDFLEVAKPSAPRGGKAKQGQDSAGQGREGQGREGQGREGQDSAGQKVQEQSAGN